MTSSYVTMPLGSHAQTIVSWQTVRWVWHTTFYKDVSHVMFYEDIKASELIFNSIAMKDSAACVLCQTKMLNWSIYFRANVYIYF